MRGKFVLFSFKDSYKTEAISTEIDLNTDLIIRIERKQVARHFNIIGCCDVFSMTYARAMHVRLVNDKLVKL